MSKPVISNIDLEKYKYQKEIIEQTAQQVIKDFGMFGVDIVFSGNTSLAYNELFDQLSHIISDLLKTNYSKLQSILYQVDLNPKKLFKEEKGVTIEDKIADSVLTRELQKVVTRLYFKLNPDKI